MGIKTAEVIELKDTSRVALTDYQLTSLTAVQTEHINIEDNDSLMTLLVTEDKSGGAGDVDIYAEYSDDGNTFYRPYTSDMAGVISQEGNIVTALQNVTRWIVFTPRLAKYMRLVFDPDADSQVTAKLIRQKIR